MGLDLEDMDGLSIGLIYDMMTENMNDDIHYNEVATQDDMDNF